MADVLINNDVHSYVHSVVMRAGIFWTSPTVGYVLYIDRASYDLKYDKTADGGATWAGATNVRTGTMAHIDCWADWQTDGDAGTKIHIAYLDEGSDDVRYCYLDTNGDSVGGDVQIEACQGDGAMNAHAWNTGLITICKARGGNLAVGFRYTEGTPQAYYLFYTSIDAGANWVSKASPWEADSNDFLQLYAGNEADNQDLWAAFWDASASEISLQTFDNSGNSWSEQLISGSMTWNSALFGMDGQIRLSDGHLIFAAWSAHDNAASDLMVWDINGAGSITAKTDVITNEAENVTVSVFVNQVNDDLYITYAQGTAAASLVKVFYQLSQDGGANWDGETAMQANAEDDERWVSGGCLKAANGGKFLPIWFNDDDNDIFCNTDESISIAASAVGLSIPVAMHHYKMMRS